jgi:hypothetical protein
MTSRGWRVKSLLVASRQRLKATARPREVMRSAKTALRTRILLAKRKGVVFNATQLVWRMAANSLKTARLHKYRTERPEPKVPQEHREFVSQVAPWVSDFIEQVFPGIASVSPSADDRYVDFLLSRTLTTSFWQSPNCPEVVLFDTPEQSSFLPLELEVSDAKLERPPLEHHPQIQVTCAPNV